MEQEAGNGVSPSLQRYSSSNNSFSDRQIPDKEPQPKPQLCRRSHLFSIPEMMMRIFSFLRKRERGACRLVCKLWCFRMAPIFWESLSICCVLHADSFTAPETSSNLHNNFSLVRSFSTSYMPAWETFILHAQNLKDPPRLTYLEYQHPVKELPFYYTGNTLQYTCRAFLEQLSHLVWHSLRWLPHLRHLHLDIRLPIRHYLQKEIELLVDSITDTQLFTEGKLHISSIQVLEIVDSSFGAGIHIWAPLIEACPKLRQLSITRPQSSTQYRILTEFIQRYCPDLHELKLLKGWEHPVQEDLDTALVVASGGPNLTLLDLREIPQVADQSFAAILELSGILEHLYLPSCTETSESYLPNILGSCRRLKTLCVDQNPSSSKSVLSLDALELLKVDWVCDDLETFSVLISFPTNVDDDVRDQLQEESFRRLGSLHQLRRLCQSVSRGPCNSEFQGYDSDRGTFLYMDRHCHERITNGLDFSKVRNLRHLGKLTEMQLLDVRSIYRALGAEALQWMEKQWPNWNELRVHNMGGCDVGVKALLLQRPGFKCHVHTQTLVVQVKTRYA